MGTHRIAVLTFCLAIAIAAVTASRPIHVGHSPINRLQFVDAEVGWMIGQDGLFRTDDGGVTWRSLNSRLAPFTSDPFDRSGLNSGFFLDARRGFVVSQNEHLLRTVDGGHNWRLVELPVPSVDDGVGVVLRDVQFSSELRGWILGSTRADKSVARPAGSRRRFPRPDFLLRTDDGGQSWRLVNETLGADTLGFEARADGLTIIARRPDRTSQILTSTEGAVWEPGARLPSIADRYRVADNGSAYTWHSNSPRFGGAYVVGPSEVVPVGTPGQQLSEAMKVQPDSQDSWKLWDEFYGNLTVAPDGVLWAWVMQTDRATSHKSGLILASLDDGATWQLRGELALGKSELTAGRFFFLPPHGWVVFSRPSGHGGSVHAVMRTDDWGESWKQVFGPRYLGERPGPTEDP